jgi:phage shock protein E
MKLISRNKFHIIGISLGALLGYVYYYFIGCKNGHCIITASPWMSILYGALLGGLLADSIKNKP